MTFFSLCVRYLRRSDKQNCEAAPMCTILSSRLWAELECSAATFQPIVGLNKNTEFEIVLMRWAL